MTSELVTFAGRAGTIAGERWHTSSSRGTLLLLHGGAQTRHSWSRSGVRFSDGGWTTIALDARGHGDSQWDPAGDYGMSALVDDLVGVVDQLGESPVLVGASMGGMTALVAEGEHAPLARALVLVDIATRAEPAGVARIFEFMRSAPDGFASLEDVADAISAYNPHRERPKSLDGLRKNVRQGADGRWRWHWDPAFLRVPDEPRREAHEARLDDAAQGVTVPTMLVRGKDSDVVSPEGAEHLQRLIPHAVVREARAGHMVAGDDNDVFVSQVVDFLDDTLP
ncbi:alpha/beta fold hydrolase [Aeromicrobium fastidiosum]|uniref:Alpha/beta hydrolase n=1 Tax=Aeromicrobium fastidiosum TaxID=52699 RepID=A0A641AJZ4_9ACTN|nr:alpha/beta hydrolase [Aeromicrobium fastidiosum]KAA1375996.1 alpha/beta hydrolase [Aeromicrobium fastidiosum]MBP2392142.1 pimeloyl-ACP methyl ester carboxylesterase [Aeromicrobium fastidiosum]